MDGWMARWNRLGCTKRNVPGSGTRWLVQHSPCVCVCVWGGGGGGGWGGGVGVWLVGWGGGWGGGEKRVLGGGGGGGCPKCSFWWLFFRFLGFVGGGRGT